MCPFFSIYQKLKDDIYREFFYIFIGGFLMQYLKRPVVPVLRGKKAVDALYEYVENLKTIETSPKLTKKQKLALARIARVLISSLELEEYAKVHGQSIDVSAQMKRLKGIIHHSLKELTQPRTEQPNLPNAQLYSHLTTGYVK
jgi:hypothetical protein